MPDGQKFVVMRVQPNAGYSPFQIDNPLSLGEIRDMVASAIEEHGEDALLVTKDPSNSRGASWGYLGRAEEITAYEPEDEF